MSKTTIHIKDIFSFGAFGPVQLGQTIDEVQNSLGKPTFVYDSIYGAEDEYNVKFLRYDSYEFWFIRYYDDSGTYKLSGIQVRDYHFINGYEGHFKKGVVLDTWIFKFGLSMHEIEQALVAEEMSFTKAEEYDFQVFIFENNAKIYFIKREYSVELVCEGWTYHPTGFMASVKREESSTYLFGKTNGTPPTPLKFIGRKLR